MGMASPLNPAGNVHLPAHLRDVCDLLARGLLRLRSRTVEDLARDADEASGSGDIRLHSTAHQRRRANRRREGLA